MGDLDALKESMQQIGLLNPIILTSDYFLVAGQRRLEAAKSLGWKQIQCLVIEEEDPELLLRVEMDENAARKDFTSDEMADALLRLDRLQNPPWPKRLVRWFRKILRRLAGFFRRSRPR
ncbi:MAG: chromosome partitioning protein ParB [Spirochaetaceae bacterium]|nr:MAG: chromosome partitioning protein ParB [Spirochaetaceae bacterium]